MANNWGGARQGAGRKKEENSKKTVVVRVDESLLPTIKVLKERHKGGQNVEPLLNVTDNQDVDLKIKIKELNDKPLMHDNELIVKYNKEHERADNLQSELDNYKKFNLDCVLQKDNANLKAVKLQGRVNSLQSDIRTLKAQLESLKHKEYDCMVLKKDGSRCSRPAKIKIKWHGVEINSCLQHSKTN